MENTHRVYRCDFATKYRRGTDDLPLDLDTIHVFLRRKRVYLEGTVRRWRYAQAFIAFHAFAMGSTAVLLL